MSAASFSSGNTPLPLMVWPASGRAPMIVGICVWYSSQGLHCNRLTIETPYSLWHLLFARVRHSRMTANPPPPPAH